MRARRQGRIFVGPSGHSNRSVSVIRKNPEQQNVGFVNERVEDDGDVGPMLACDGVAGEKDARRSGDVDEQSIVNGFQQQRRHIGAPARHVLDDGEIRTFIQWNDVHGKGSCLIIDADEDEGSHSGVVQFIPHGPLNRAVPPQSRAPRVNTLTLVSPIHDNSDLNDAKIGSRDRLDGVQRVSVARPARVGDREASTRLDLDTDEMVKSMSRSVVLIMNC